MQSNKVCQVIVLDFVLADSSLWLILYYLSYIFYVRWCGYMVFFFFYYWRLKVSNIKSKTFYKTFLFAFSMTTLLDIISNNKKRKNCFYMPLISTTFIHLLHRSTICLAAIFRIYNLLLYGHQKSLSYNINFVIQTPYRYPSRMRQ